ncbi:MAG: hypothetical protein QOJ82_2205 [Solirubrobacteraceae bacterium]|nr:hypothetical protein [Solirubrobacteraceae bacterium]
MRGPRLGLRTRLVVALIATSAATLVAAMAALVSPMEHRLVADRVAAMRDVARTARLALARMPPRDLRRDVLNKRVHDLARRTGGRVALFDAQGLELSDTDPERPDPRSGQPERLEDAGFARAGDVRSGARDGEAIVITTVPSRRGRLTLVIRKPLNDARAAAAVVRRALPVAGGVALAVAVGLGILLSFGLLRRLERLRSGARRLAEEGIERPLEVEAGHDQIAEVGRALETMRVRLYASERGRQVFLSTASHELRTPLASLRAILELLDEELAGDAPNLGVARHRAAAARRQTGRLTSLAGELLDLARMDADLPLDVETVELAELAGTMTAEAESAAAASGVALRVDAARPVWARADPRALARILRALLDNAISHGAPSVGSVTVSVDADGDTAIVRVTDDGPGVQESDHERIFGRFERGDRDGPGFGLGLSIARGLARRMGGDVRSEPSDSGACFVTTLPRREAPVGAAWQEPPTGVPAA